MILTENGVLKLMQRIKSYIASQLNTKANSVHTHSISEIDNLASQLGGGGYTKSESDDKFVDKTSNQTINGAKTFSKTITVKDNVNTNGKDLLYLIDDTINTSNEDENGFPLTGHTCSLKIRGHGTNMLPLMLTGQVFTSGDTSAELRTYKYKDITSDNCRATFQLRYSYANNAGIVYFSNIGSIVPTKTNKTILGSPSYQWNNTYTRNILIDNDINITSSVINKTSNSGSLALRGGTNYSDGASIGLYGKDYNGGSAGAVNINAYGNSDYTNLYIYPNGTMSVYNNSTGTTKNIAIKEDVDTLLNGKANTSHTHSKSEITDFPTLATVATSGSYSDLSDKPTIPTVNNATLTIQKNGTNVATFTANASSNVTANITVPTNTNQLTNGNGFITTEIDSSGTGWVRFKCGIQICYGNATNNNGLGDGIMRVSFSKAFNAKPNLTATPNISAGYLCTALVESTSTWVLNTYAYNNGGINHVRDGLNCNFIAVGTWK